MYELFAWLLPAEASRDLHRTYCENNEAVRVEMPKNEILEFVDGQAQFKVLFVMYYDLESLLPPIPAKSRDSKSPYTNLINQHIPCGWNVRSKFAYGEVKNPETSYRGSDCIITLCEHFISETHHLYKSFPEKPMDPLSIKEQIEYMRSTRCHICFKNFKQDNPKVRDHCHHCHYTGKYRGPSHNNCNLRYRVPLYIPVIAYNSAGFDTHLFIKELAKHFDDIGVISKSKEEYITFSVKIPVDKYIDKNGEEKDRFMELRFVDSFKFMATSLDSLAKNLVSSGNRLSGFEGYSESQYKLLTRKGIYPYQYMTSWGRFDETKLPPIEAFYSSLNMSGVSESDYQHAQRVWTEFNIKNLGEYHDLYLKTDVVLLESIFETFRKTSLAHYGLDPAHFFTLPGLAWKGCLKKTNIRLALLCDPNMLLMFERGIQGGITQAVHRYASTNNKHMESKYDPNQESTYIQYLDANNLYGWAMSQPLPTCGFKWVDIQIDEISELAKLKNKGYLLEVDVSYPRSLHDSHSDLPFMFEKISV